MHHSILQPMLKVASTVVDYRSASSYLFVLLPSFCEPCTANSEACILLLLLALYSDQH